MRWLAEGLRDCEVLEKLATEEQVTVCENTVRYYRTAYADQIAEAYEDAFTTAAKQGLCNRIARLRVLERNAETMVANTKGGGKGFAQVNAELRATLRDIRDELGDLKERHELSGPGGGPMKMQIGWFDAVEEWENQDAAGGETAGDGDGDAAEPSDEEAAPQ